MKKTIEVTLERRHVDAAIVAKRENPNGFNSNCCPMVQVMREVLGKSVRMGYTVVASSGDGEQIGEFDSAVGEVTGLMAERWPEIPTPQTFKFTFREEQ